MIAKGATQISKVCLGSNELSKVCLGSTELWSARPPMPYDAEVEYIESTGTQWLDTGIKATNGILMEYYGAMAGTTAAPIVGTWVSASERIGIYKYSTYNIAAWKNNNVKYIRVSPKDNTFYEVSFDTRGTSFIVKWNGTEKENSTTSDAVSSLHTIKVFYNEQSSVVVPGKIKILKLTDMNGNVVFNAKAVRIDQAGYLYDSISQTLLGSETADAFAVGADIG